MTERRDNISDVSLSAEDEEKEGENPQSDSSALTQVDLNRLDRSQLDFSRLARRARVPPWLCCCCCYSSALKRTPYSTLLWPTIWKAASGAIIVYTLRNLSNCIRRFPRRSVGRMDVRRDRYLAIESHMEPRCSNTSSWEVPCNCQVSARIDSALSVDATANLTNSTSNRRSHTRAILDTYLRTSPQHRLKSPAHSRKNICS